MQISGAVRFPPSSGPAEVAVVRVTVQQPADGPVLAEVGLPLVSVPPEGLELPFTLDAGNVDDPGSAFTLRAHADRSGSGSVESGDLVADVTTPVDPTGEEPVVLELAPVD
ncbi:MAG TPA: hypothetical protein VF045_08275 [Acidimicrobiales bacterium]|jgi:hypothetical protein